MINPSPKNPRMITNLISMALACVLMTPLTVIAEPTSVSCKVARTEMEQTRKVLLPLEQKQQQIQQHVRTVYQELLACHSGLALPSDQQERCTTLSEEGAKQFQALINAITQTHQTSQQLTHQTHQVQLACPTIAEDTFPKTTSLPSLQKIARNN